MDHVDSAPERAQAFLAKEPVLWLGTVRADGHPHLVPTWFVWDGRKILSFSKPHAVKVRAVAADPRVMIALGSPLDLEREWGLSGGHPLHAEPGLDQFFMWRPLLGHARYRMPIEGLYLAGSGAHPGGGVTGGPGANAARAILADGKRAR